MVCSARLLNWVCVPLLCCGVSLPGALAAQPLANDSRWDEERWGHVSTPELTVLGFATAGALASAVFSEPRSEGWRGGILLDEPVRDALRLNADSDRSIASGVSDVLLWSLVAWPVVDSLALLTLDRDPEAASQTMAINGLAYATTLLATGLAKNLAGRERPFGRLCDRDQPSRECRSSNRYRSFFSGHAALSFTGASLVCAHHGALEFYGGAADAVACGSALALASVTGLLRVLADRHYLSDVLVGALVGVLGGFVLPQLAHYQRP